MACFLCVCGFFCIVLRFVNDVYTITEWKLGSEPEGDDIFPSLKVGTNQTGSAAIVKGKLELNKIPVNKTVAEFYKMRTHQC